MDNFGINEDENQLNSYLTTLFPNGEIKACENGVQDQCESPKLIQLHI